MTRCIQSRTERGEPLDKGNTINGISHCAKATNILWKKLTVGCSVGQNENEAFEGKSWLQGVVGRGAHIPPGEFVSVSGKKITYLSSLLTTAGVGPGDSVMLPMRVELYRHLLDKYFNEEKILK